MFQSTCPSSGALKLLEKLQHFCTSTHVDTVACSVVAIQRWREGRYVAWQRPVNTPAISGLLPDNRPKEKRLLGAVFHVVSAPTLYSEDPGPAKCVKLRGFRRTVTT
jgi:hypothetical protein